MKYRSKVFILKHRRIKIKNKEIYIRKIIKMSNILSEYRRRESSKAMTTEKMVEESNQVADSWSSWHTIRMKARKVKPPHIMIKLLKAKNKGKI